MVETLSVIPRLTKACVRSRKRHSAVIITVTVVVWISFFFLVFLLSPKCCCPNHKPLDRKKKIKISETGRGAAAPLPPAPTLWGVDLIN